MVEAILILSRQILSRGHGILQRIRLDRRRFDGGRQTLDHEVYDSGDGAALLLYDPGRSRIVLISQFRVPAYLNGGHEKLIEVCAGRLEGADPQTRIVREAEEETGFQVRAPRRLFEAYMSPGCFCERLTFFVAQYSPGDRIGAGGGLADEGEDIEILEPTLDEALAMVERGEIIDAKTIILLQYAKLAGLMHAAAAPANQHGA
ncbi:NUDIX domain-containing protein [Methylocapsa palsarum]|uniref:GDP-mannose pyrophosphatase n=1 Tax=Methylocapsa palsarum TaxID=1612308 RepID=A0A1I3YKY4_9HYPH|nr:NUDIX domain-containing protein [Methylocapsa palsarum]SFK32494.1 nudix-type nucleoside diphosphatase, YffH/AdpP family [Methylocapsa palsarum]